MKKQNVNYDLVEPITLHSSKGCRNISLQANHESNQWIGKIKLSTN